MTIENFTDDFTIEDHTQIDAQGNSIPAFEVHRNGTLVDTLGSYNEALVLIECIETEEYVDDAYRKLAEDRYGSEGSIEIDSNATVSRGDDAGAYVQAWVWVYDNDLPDRARQLVVNNYEEEGA